MAAEKNRIAYRKETEAISVSNLTALDHFAQLARSAHIVDISSTGIQLHVHRDDLLPELLRSSLNLDSLIGEHIMMEIDLMNLDIDGLITRTKPIGQGWFELGIDYSAGAPEYWRECLVDLIPTPGEIEDEEEEFLY